jgi:hypothetical protein
VARIAALSDPVVRNLQITQAYHELALAMTARTGICANWCTFATWASKQAGQTIRKEDFARLIEEILTAEPSAQAVTDVTVTAQSFGSPKTEDEIEESIADVLNPLAALNRASDAVARGNRKVFEEIGREFARFAADCMNDAAYDVERIARFCGELRDGEPPDGQRYLRQAFARYYRAFFEPDVKARAELILLANIEIGFHEQTRLQPEIAAAMDAAFIARRTFRVRAIKALFPPRGLLGRLRLLLIWLFDRPSPFDSVVNLLLDEARRRARLVITKAVMRISLPHGRIRLGDDLTADYPEVLRQITLADLLALLGQLDPTPDSTRDSGAADWAALPERLHFIIDMFRCYHESSDLFDPPFLPSQVAALKAGRLPGGKL